MGVPGRSGGHVAVVTDVPQAPGPDPVTLAARNVSLGLFARWLQPLSGPGVAGSTCLCVDHQNGTEFVSAVDGDIVGGIGGPPGGLVVDVDGDGALEDVEVSSRKHRVRFGIEQSTPDQANDQCLVKLWRRGSPEGSPNLIASPAVCGPTVDPSRRQYSTSAKSRYKLQYLAGGPTGNDVEMSRPVALLNDLVPGLSTPSTAPTRSHMVIVHVSTGFVTALDPSGAVLWQTPTQVAWTVWTQSVDINSVFPYSINVDGDVLVSSAMLLVVAGNKVAVLRARDGSLVQEETLEDSVAGVPRFLDVSGDGLVDVVLPCARGVLALEATSSASSVIAAGLLFAVMGIVALVVAVCDNGMIQRLTEEDPRAPAVRHAGQDAATRPMPAPTFLGDSTGAWFSHAHAD